MSSGAANLNGSTSSITTLNGGSVNLGSTALTVSNGSTSVAITDSGGSLIKDSSGTLTLTGTNTYGGTTSVSNGKLVINGSLTGSGTVRVDAGATLSGTGSVAGTTAIAATAKLSPTAQLNGATPMTLGATTLTAGSIFEWSMSAVTPSVDPVTKTNQGTYGQVSAGATSGTSVFSIVLGSGNSFSDAFWNTSKSWSNIFTATSGASDLSTLFTTFSGTDVNPTTGAVSVSSVPVGRFSFSGSTLSYTAVPEPTSALAGFLLGAGLLRRRREDRTIYPTHDSWFRKRC